MLSQNAISLYVPSSPSSSSSHKNTHSLISSLDFTEEMQRQKMGFREYIEALEEERKKIQVFPKELPLSLELITQAIEACRQQFSGTTTEYNLNGQSESSEQTSMEEGPILEEFIPIKKRVSPDCEEEDEQHSHQAKISKDNNNNSDIKRKSDWLRSVQLWNPDPPAEEELPRKAASVVEVKRNTNRSGAFQPFHRDESVGKTTSGVSAGKAQAPSSSAPVAAKSSAPAGAVGTDNGGSSCKREEKEGQRKQRRCWSEELHKRFLQALQQLGGADCATPKQIRELMKVDGLTNDEVKSHLQKFRLHTKRPSPMVNNNANPQTAPFVLVGNIFVQPPEYETTVATSAASGELTTVTAPTGVYAPVAAHPSPAVPLPHTLAVSIKKPEFKKVELYEHSHSEERANNQSEGAVHSNSRASSTSTHTTTTSSHGY